MNPIPLLLIITDASGHLLLDILGQETTNPFANMTTRYRTCAQSGYTRIRRFCSTMPMVSFGATRVYTSFATEASTGYNKLKIMPCPNKHASEEGAMYFSERLESVKKNAEYCRLALFPQVQVPHIVWAPIPHRSEHSQCCRRILEIPC